MSYDEAKNKYQNYMQAVDKAYKDKDGRLALELSYQKKEMEALGDKLKTYEDAEWKVKDYTENIKTYESNYAKFAEGKYSEIDNTITTKTEEWCDKSVEEIKNSIKEQSKELQNYKEQYERTDNEIAKQQREQVQKNLNSLIEQLKERTTTVGELGQDEIEAWRTLATSSYSTYFDTVSNMPPELAKKIQEMTGVTVEQTPYLAGATSTMAQEMLEQLKKNPEFRATALDNLRGMLSGLQDSELREVLKSAGVEDVEKVIEGIKQGNLGEEQGIEILSKLNEGLNNANWKKSVCNSAIDIASKLQKILTITPIIEGASTAVNKAIELTKAKLPRTQRWFRLCTIRQLYCKATQGRACVDKGRK